MSVVARKEWIVVERRDDCVLLEEEGGGARHRLSPGLLPEDVSPGDRFSVVAQLDRRAEREAGAAEGAAGVGPRDGSDAVFSEAVETLSHM